MARLLPALPVTLLLAVTMSLSGCGGESADDSSSSKQGSSTVEESGEESVEEEGPGDGGDSYEQRLTPVARIKEASDIRVEGKHAWVTVPATSTSGSVSLECLQLLPARMDGETLTVIFSDGVEELCEWPEDLEE